MTSRFSNRTIAAARISRVLRETFAGPLVTVAIVACVVVPGYLMVDGGRFRPELAPLWLVPAGAVWLGRVLRRETRAITGRLAEVLGAHDPDALSEWRALFVAAVPKTSSREALASFVLGSEMMLRERWSEARAALASVDKASLHPSLRHVLANDRARAALEDGDADEACEIALRATEEAKRLPEEEREKVLPLLEGTLDRARTASGKPD